MRVCDCVCVLECACVCAIVGAYVCVCVRVCTRVRVVCVRARERVRVRACSRARHAVGVFVCVRACVHARTVVEQSLGSEVFTTPAPHMKWSCTHDGFPCSVVIHAHPAWLPARNGQPGTVAVAVRTRQNIGNQQRS
jgi:hypothetical protein